MNVLFEDMPGNARLWVYQADRKLSQWEVAEVKRTTASFTDQWQAHGQPLSAAFDIQYSRFLIITVDESTHGASGCSIDASVNLIRHLEEKLSVSFLDRTKVAYIQDDEVRLMPLTQIREVAAGGRIDPDTPVFNNSVSTMRDFQSSWIVPAGESWLKRYFK